MRTVRSIVALISTLAVLACQTAASVSHTGTTSRAAVPATSAGAERVDRPLAASEAVKSDVVVRPVTAETSKRKTLIIVAVVVAAAIVVALALSGGDGIGGGY